MSRILVVDDEKGIIRFFKAAFQKTGDDLYVSDSVEKSMEIIRTKSVDVVIADIYIADESGLELLKKVRTEFEDIPVIMITGEPGFETATESLREGAFDYIVKPLSVLVVYKIVDQALRLRSLSLEKKRLELDNADYRIQLEMKIHDQTRRLEDRLRKINTLFGIPLLSDNTDCTFTDFVKKTVDMIPDAFQDRVCYSARITWEGMTYESIPFFESPEILGCEICLNKKAKGRIDVYRSEQNCEAGPYPFSDEDEHFLKAVCKNIEQVYIQKMDREMLDKTQNQLIHSEKMGAIGQIAAGVAHEINNPISFVGSNLRTLGSYVNDLNDLIVKYRTLVGEAELTNGLGKTVEAIRAKEKEMDLEYVLDDIRQIVDESLEGIEKTKKIVHDLKVFAHPGSDSMVLADINKNLDLTLNVVWNELKYNVAVIKDYGDIPEVYCYPQQLSQVFANMFVNAAHAITNRGEIRIRTRHSDEFIEITIEDTGEGIPPENISRIFDPFFTTKEVGKGTGLGMNVAYQIVRKHNGTIHVESTVGKGTCFTVRIPVVAGELDA